MDLKTKRTICLMVGIISILTIVGTISYAYFTATAQMVPTASTLTTGTARVRFADNDLGISGELTFGESLAKKFTIENTGTVEANVKMYWIDLINTYLSDSLTYTLSYSETEEGPYTEVISKTNVPQSESPTKEVLANSLTIPVGKTYYYNLVITLNYLDDLNQDSDITARFSSYFNLEDINHKEVTIGIDTSLATLNITSQGIRTSFDEAATTDEGVFEMEDDYGTSYYYRGAVTNNYVQFAGFYWRIIRVNGDGSLRIVYDGDQAYANGANSSARFIGTSAYNTNYNDAKYVGYMYGPAGTTASTSAAQAQTNTSDSTIKTYIDAWYKTNIVDAGYSSAVVDEIFCNDRSTPGSAVTGWSSDTGLGYGTNYTAFGAYSREGPSSSLNYNNPQPTFKCAQKNDAFTVSDTVKGNGALTYPVGLITADEIVAAGSGKFNTANTSYYLYRPSNWWWSLSPNYMDTSGYALVFAVSTYGHLNSIYVNTAGAVAPVISLSAEYVSTLRGNGTMTDPYTAA